MVGQIIAPDVLASKTVDTNTHQALLDGEILLETRSHTNWGAGVTAQMYVPLPRPNLWAQLTDYSHWVHYFPDMTQSQVLNDPSNCRKRSQRLYQTASKTLLMWTVEVEAYLKVFELEHSQWQRVQFCLEQGSFSDFSADLKLQDYAAGTLLTYSVEATPLVPVPSMLIQQAIRFDLPINMRQMRLVLCNQ
jgi:hypothetical protein